MARQLDSEKTFLVLTDMPTHPMIESYRIMNAVILSLDSSYDSSLYGTLIAISASEETFATLSKTSLRFFGILVGDTYTIRTKKDYHPTSKAESGYIAVPTFHEPATWPEGFWGVAYPHITLVPPSHKIQASAEMLFLVECFYSDLMLTENTYVHHVLLGEKQACHITRAVRHGKKPVLAGQEVVPGVRYTECSGHSVIM